ncbi:MAG: glycoside hydrolase family 95 protein [Deinococcota bacterium]
MTTPLTLVYTQAAQKWVEALPVGNGRQGAMIFGGVAQERIQFNEDTVWTGKPHDYSHLDAYKYYPKLKELMAEMLALERVGKWDDAKAVQDSAHALASEHFMSIPLGQKTYQPTGDLWIDFPHNDVQDYTRSLSLDNAVSTVSYKHEGVTYQRDVFASFPDQVIVVRLSADQANALSCKISLNSPHETSSTTVLNDAGLLLEGEVEQDGIRFATQLVVELKDGKLTANGNSLMVDNASEVIITLTSSSSFVSFQDISADPVARCQAVMGKLTGTSYDDLKTRHVNDHQSLFNRVSLELGDGSTNTDTLTRLLAKDKTQDPDLYALYFQYGRYLLIASSRAGSQPANLQGIWNHQKTPAWDSKWTTNINVEMNYWPAEITNLSECHEPLFALLEDLTITGKKVAQEHYSARGWVLHHNTDLWRGAAPINHSGHGIWPAGGLWLCQHLWWHYTFTLDEDFLRERAYPIMREACLFVADILTLDEATGWLISPVSNSPELGDMVAAPSMDHQIMRELLTNTIQACNILELDKDFKTTLSDLRAKIAPNSVGKHGQLQEWLVDKDDPNETHRHVSHLWGLHPGREITEATPDLFEAAEQSLRYRGDGGTGWSLAWKIAFWARLKHGDKALQLLNTQLNFTEVDHIVMEGGGTYANLFDAHPPFQIDGNLGATAGIAEMLLQSHTGYIELLPALPRAWSTGAISGLRAPNNFEISFRWQDGKLSQVSIIAHVSKLCTLRYKDKTINWQAEEGKTYTFDGKLELNSP